MALFESYERRIDKINEVLNSYGIASLEEAEKITKDAGLDVYNQIKGIQPICFENACWAYITGAAIAIKKGCTRAADAAAAIGEGLQAFCIPGSVADQRKVGLGHGNLGKMLLEEETDCFAFLAGHESFAAAEGAIGIAEKANKVRKKPLRVILNGLGKDAAKIISRINGFTYVQTDYDYYTGELKEVSRTAYSDGLRSKVNCYGANDVREGVAIMWKEGVDVSITGNSTNPTRFQHPVAGTYKKECIEQGKKYFSVASGGGTGPVSYTHLYGRTQSAFSEDGLAVGAGLEDLGKGLRSQVGTMYGTLKKGPRYLEMAEGYVTGIALDKDNQIIGYKFVNLGKMTDFIKKGDDANTAYEKACGQYGRVADAVKIIDPRTDEEVK